MSTQRFIELSEKFFADTDFVPILKKLQLDTIEKVFSFNQGSNLSKPNLASYRTRIQIEIDSPQTTLFLKRYKNPPLKVQLKNWLNQFKITTLAKAELDPIIKLSALEVNCPKPIAFGWIKKTFFEKKSFLITEKIPNAQSLEQKLPACFYEPQDTKNRKLRNEFIKSLALFIQKFHNAGYRHRDLYLCHIFFSDDKKFYLIDLARAFRPKLLKKRFQVKDIAQLYYSAGSHFFSRTDRLRFFHCYINSLSISPAQKRFISKVKKRAKKMAKHDIKHNRIVPYTNS